MPDRSHQDDARAMFRLLRQNLIAGVGAGWVVLAAFFALDIAQLRSLTLGSPDGPLAIVVLIFFFGLTFGSLAMGYGVMTNHRDGESGGYTRLPRADVPLQKAAPAKTKAK